MRRAVLVFCVAFALTFGATMLSAQTTPLIDAYAGRWEARLGRSGFRLLLELDRTVDSLWLGTLVSVDQGGARIPLERIDVSRDSLLLEIRTLGVTYAARLSEDAARLTGRWTQGGGSTTLDFTRSTTRPPAPSTAVRGNELDVPLTLAVAVRPVPLSGGGLENIVYEIHVTNHSATEQLVTAVEVFADTASVARWSGVELHRIMAQRRDDVRDNRLIPDGGWAIVNVWLALDGRTPVPAMLRHQLTVGGRKIVGTVAVDARAPLVIGPPLRGGDWIARNGPDNYSGHRRALVPLGGVGRIAQRYAIDWAKVDSAGRLFRGDAADNRSYSSYGSDAIAVADGIVVAVKDGVPENVPGATTRAVPMTLETVTGNSVVLQLERDRFAFYGHLQPGSLRVKVGDRVKRAQLLGLVGNSGNSTGPHLHFHVADSPSPLAAEGVPYVIDAWDQLRSPGMWERRLREMPLFEARVRFPPR